MTTRPLSVGLATYRAIAALYGEAHVWALEETGWERELQLARAAFLDGGKATEWKGYFAVPADARQRALLAEDLHAWGALSGLVPEFEPRGRNGLVRQALMNLAAKLQEVA